MSKREKKLNLPSLAQHFDAPAGYKGHFGWLCGYSADAKFLNDAAERFTLQTEAQRAYLGYIHLAVMLDPGTPPISLLDAPGVMHAAIKNLANKSFVLLHAKVALLSFLHQNDRSRWLLRLIVSTGNWTRQTLEDGLDLAWRIDVCSEDIRKGDNAGNQFCADICAAQNLLTWIGERFDLSLLSVAGATNTRRNQMEKWVKQCAKRVGGAKPRIFDNREKAIIEQLPSLIKHNCSNATRNYLAMGSGFYESAKNERVVPSVPQSIASRLRKEKLLTASPELDLFVDPAGCEAVASSVKALNDQGFIIRPAARPQLLYGENSQRSLHAKFIFSASYRKDSNWCNSAWIYLGSANLTRQGFANRMNARDGNLEAGVVFMPETLAWEIMEDIDPSSVVTNVLPMQWDIDIKPDNKTIQAGPDMPERNEQFVAAPISWLTWRNQSDGNGGILQPPQDVAMRFEVLFFNENRCDHQSKGFIWPGSRPRVVTLLWHSEDGIEQRSAIPVIDEFGRIAATELPNLDPDAAWWQLAAFPMPPDDEESDREDGSDEENLPDKKKAIPSKPTPDVTYPVRQMMELIENIAAKQTEVCEVDWLVWCNRLEQTLNQMKNSHVVEYFRSHLKLNPLSPLFSAPFRPSFAETTQTEQGRCYEEALRRVANTWGIQGLALIGGI